MAFYIKPTSRSWGYADHGDIRVYLGLAENAKLPHEMSKEITVPLKDGRETTLYVKASTPAEPGPRRWQHKKSAHRCFAICPDCQAHVPAGRTHQHKCKS